MRKNVGGLPRRRIKKSEPWQLFATFRPHKAWANSKASSLLRDNRCAAKPKKAVFSTVCDECGHSSGRLAVLSSVSGMLVVKVRVFGR